MHRATAPPVIDIPQVGALMTVPAGIIIGTFLKRNAAIVLYLGEKNSQKSLSLRLCRWACISSELGVVLRFAMAGGKKIKRTFHDM